MRAKDALDKLIAAHAIALGVTLMTNNEADFIDCPLLVVENWVDNHWQHGFELPAIK